MTATPPGLARRLDCPPAHSGEQSAAVLVARPYFLHSIYQRLVPDGSLRQRRWPPAAMPPFTPPPQCVFDHLSIEDGLSQNAVLDLLQDRDGFLWFGTQDGLNRYDGYTFTVFKHDPDDPNTLSYNSILPLIQDSRGQSGSVRGAAASTASTRPAIRGHLPP